MKRRHLWILIAVALVLALFAFRAGEKSDTPPTPITRPVPQPAEQQREKPSPGASIGREDQTVGTTALPRAAGAPERP